MSVASLSRGFARVRPLFSRYGVWLWFAGLAIFSVAFALRQRGELDRIGAALGSADLRWLLGVLLLQCLSLVLTALAYQVLLRRLGHHLSWPRLLSIHLQRHVVGTVTPVGGPASVYVFLRALNRHGVSSSDGLLVAALRSVTGYASFVAVLIPAIVLFHPSGLVLASAGALVLFLGGLVGGLVLVLRGEGHAVSPRLARHLPARAASFVERARRHGVRPRDLWQPFALALLANLTSMFMLYFSLLAIGQRPSLITPLVGFAIGNLFMMVAPVFQGIGMVELSMALALQQLGIPSIAAVGATLLFRLGDLWWPLAAGVTAQAAARVDARTFIARAPAAALGAVGALTFVFSLASLLPVSVRYAFDFAWFEPSDLSPVTGIWTGLCCFVVAFGLWRGGPLTRYATYGVLALVPGIVFDQRSLLVSFWPL